MPSFDSLTDIARHKDQGRTDDLIPSWLRNRNAIALLWTWEQLNTPEFKPVEFDGFKMQAGLNRVEFNLSRIGFRNMI